MNITGRDNFIIAKALCIASAYLKKQKNPELADIADMEAILNGAFPGRAGESALFDDIKTAARLGIFDAGGQKEFTPHQLRARIEQERGRDNVVDF